jgi:hypothetical protein
MTGKTEDQVIAERHGYAKASGIFETFVKGDVHVWFCFTGWARAVVINGNIIGKQIYADLEKALDGDDDPNAYTVRNPL